MSSSSSSKALRVVRDEIAVALHEPVEVVLLASRPLLDHLVQLGEHVAEACERLRRHVLQAVGHVPEVRAQHLLAQMLHQLVEEPLRLGIHEPVLRELADLPGRVGRERIQEHLPHAGVVLGLERQRAPFAVQDLLELFADLLERAAEVERLLLLLAHVGEPTTERVQAGEPSLHPSPHQPSQRAFHARAHQDVVGELLQDVGRVDLGTEGILGAVPARVAVSHPFSLRGVAPFARATPPARSVLERIEPVRGADGRDQAHPARPLQRHESERGQQHEPRHQLAGRESGERRRAASATGRAAGAAGPTPARATTGVAVRPRDRDVQRVRVVGRDAGRLGPPTRSTRCSAACPSLLAP